MPIRSMTGFGQAEQPWPERGARLRVELRAVNSRFLELKIRQPFDVAAEHALRKQLDAQLGRGRVDVVVRVTGASAQDDDPLASLGVERERLEQSLVALAELRTQAAQLGTTLVEPNSLELLRFLVASRAHPGADKDGYGEAPPLLRAVVAAALDQMLGMREREGASLATTLAELYDQLEAGVASLESSLVGEGERLFDRLIARSEQLLARVENAEVDRERLAQELAVLIQRGDVSEELARITSHLAQARGTLAAEAQVGQGKTLDFLAQELLREVTTIGSKITSHTGSALVIDAKQTIERIREQVQNVE